MAKVTQQPNVELSLTFTINEGEARALDALAGYGDDAFIKVFYDNYDKLGQAYMRDHEKSLREFLTTCREFLPPALSRLDNARKGFFYDSTVQTRKTVQP